MKNHIKYFALAVTTVVFSLASFAQKKEIKVQILHEDKVVVDTTIYKSSADAKAIIENLVQQFSTDPVTIDTKLTHGLYVFNITNDSWKSPNEKIGKNDNSNTHKFEPKAGLKTDSYNWEDERKTDNSNKNNIDVDSLFNQFSHELSSSWKEAQIDIIIDSVGSSFNSMWNEMKKIDFANDPDIQNLKNDFEDLFDKIKTTRFIIIQEGDTLNFD